MKKEGTQSTCVVCGKSYYLPPSHRKNSKSCSWECRSVLISGERTDLSERFWAKVNKTDTCWLWTAGTTHSGYGSIRVKGKALRAHRVAYEMLVGPIPEGAVLMHSCDTPACCNPAHLSIGSQRENIHDAIEKGRTCHREKHWNYKISPQDIMDIQAAHIGGATGRAIAKHFSVSESLVSKILSGKRK
jgi:hypothetical protein